VIEILVERHIPPGAYAEQWDTSGLHTETLRILGLDLPIVERMNSRVWPITGSPPESFGGLGPLARPALGEWRAVRWAAGEICTLAPRSEGL